MSLSNSSTKKYLRRVLFGWLLATLLLPLSVSAAPPEQAFTAGSGQREFLLGNPDNQDLGDQPMQDIRMSGLYDRRDIVLSMPVGWTIRSNSFVEIKINHSALLIPETSNLTVLLNDQPIHSMRLDKNNQIDATWTIPIPPGAPFQPVKGRMVLTFLARMRINDMLCPPVDDKASWMTLGGNSRVVLNYTDAPPASISDLKQLFFGSTNTLDRKFSLVLPATPTTRDLTRASQVLSRLGILGGYDGFDLSFNYGSLGLPSSNQIIVGGPEIFGLLKDFSLPIPLGSSGQFTQGSNPLPENTGVVQFAASPNRAGLTLVVSGNGQEGVDRAVQSLLDDRNLGILRGTSSLVSPDSEYVKPAASARGIPSTALNGRNVLSQMGFTNQTVTGYGVQDTYFAFTVPAYNTVTGPGQFILDYNFSKVVDARRSSVSVILNDVLLGGDTLGVNATNVLPNSQAPLTPEPVAGVRPAEPSQIAVKLPKDLLRSGDNRLTIRFALYLSSGQPCGEVSTFSDLWGVVYNTSALVVQTTPTTANTPSLDLLPYPFAGGSTGSLLVVPENPDPADLRVAGHLLAEFARNEAPSQFGRIVVTNPKLVTDEQLAQNNLVLIGKPDNNPLLSKANSKLPIAWNSDTARVLSTQRGLRFGATDNSLAGVVETMVSPWSDQQTLLAIVYEPTRTDSGRNMVAAIGRKLYIGKYKGNVLALDARGKTYVFDTKDRAAPQVAPEEDNTTPGASTPVAAVTTPGSGSNSAATPVAPRATATALAATTPGSSATEPKKASNSSSLLGLGILGASGLGVLGLAGFFLWRRQRLAASRKLRK